MENLEEQLWRTCLFVWKTEDVQKLLQNPQINTNWQDLEYSRTPFCVACWKGQTEIVKLLLNDSRVDVNKADKSGVTPFYIACQKGQTAVVKLLLNETRVDVNQANNNEVTPFLTACQNGQIEIAKLLLSNERVDINKADKDSWTPFLIACQKGYVEIVKLLLHDSRVKINQANDKHDLKPFLVACENKQIEIVKILLNDKRIDINETDSEDRTPFWIACQKGQMEVVKLLLKSESTVKTIKRNNTVGNNLVDINKTNKGSQTPFWIACERGYTEIVKLLLDDKRVDLNKADKDGVTPFCVACKKGHLEIVKLLSKDKKVDVNQADNNDATPFFIACQKGYIEIVKLLLSDERVDVNKATHDTKGSFSPLFVACGKGHIEIVKLLLNEKRISIRKKTNNDGWAAIDMVKDKRSSIVQLMKEFETEQSDKRLSMKKFYEGETAIDIAKKKSHFEIVKLIKDFDTEQRYQVYLSTFQRTPFFCIENETINQQDFQIVNEHLKKNKNIKELKLRNCGLTPSTTLEILKTLISSENLQLSNMQNIVIDDIKLESTEGLETIPIEIRNQGTKSIAQYILDLRKSQTSNPLYRTKLMVVGYENVGKTTILDCLFPMEDIGETKGILQKTEYLIELQGKHFRKYKSKELDKIDREIIVENKQWNVEKIKETGLELIPLDNNNQKKMDINFKDEETRDKWFERLKRVILNSATHGIEIHNQVLRNQKKLKIVGELVKNLHATNNQQKFASSIDVSIWDFAGQHDYYNNHHYFLSTRSIFLVLWKMKDGKDGLKSLDFWFKSLSAHLQHNPTLTNGKPYFSILVVGTFLDDQNVDKSEESNKSRVQEIEEIARTNGIHYPIQIYEVSCSTLKNIDELKQSIYSTALTHGYMGEKLPIGYLKIKKSIEELRDQEKFKNLPIISLQELIEVCQTNSEKDLSFEFEFNEDFVKRGLNLLNQWGTCVYFDEPKELSDYVVLKPEFLTKEIMGKLFSPDLSKHLKDGILSHSNLKLFWKDYMDKAEILMTLMEKFEVCFKLKEDEGKPFEDQRSLIVSRLPENEPNDLSNYWPITIPRGEIEIERIFSCNQVPSEMASRLLVRFHKKIVDNIIWRRGILLKHVGNQNENVLCLLEVKMEENLFEIKIRGKERNECLEMMKYVYEEVKIVSGNYGGVKWKECVRSPHCSKGLIDLDSIEKDCKLDLTNRKLICPITHFPIYGEELLFKTGLLDTLENQENIGNDYWKYSHENQNQESQKSETESIFENSKIGNEKEYEKVKYLLDVLGFDLSKIDKVIGTENKEWKKSFDTLRQQTYSKHQNNPAQFKKEDWIEQSEPELRKSFLQSLGNYISEFRKVGWNYGNTSFVIPMIQGTSEDAAWRICFFFFFKEVVKLINLNIQKIKADDGFGTVCKVDDGYFSQGVYVTSKAEYAAKYSLHTPKVFIIGFVIVGNPFPVVEHPYSINNDGKVMLEKGKPKKNEKGYYGKPINIGYQSHFTLVNGQLTSSAFPITKAEQLNEQWIADELVIHESQICPSYIVYYKPQE